MFKPIANMHVCMGFEWDGIASYDALMIDEVVENNDTVSYVHAKNVMASCCIMPF